MRLSDNKMPSLCFQLMILHELSSIFCMYTSKNSIMEVSAIESSDLSNEVTETVLLYCHALSVVRKCGPVLGQKIKWKRAAMLDKNQQ